MAIAIATPAQLTIFQSWNPLDQLEQMTCRPIVQGKRVPPSNEVVTYAFWRADPSEPIGKFTYFDRNPRNQSAEFGYRIHPAMRGQGFGTPMLITCLNRVFQSTTLNKLYCQTAAFNIPSIRILETLGFHQDGTLREHHELDGILYDDYIYSLLRREWELQSWSDRDPQTQENKPG